MDARAEVQWRSSRGIEATSQLSNSSLRTEAPGDLVLDNAYLKTIASSCCKIDEICTEIYVYSENREVHDNARLEAVNFANHLLRMTPATKYIAIKIACFQTVSKARLLTTLLCCLAAVLILPGVFTSLSGLSTVAASPSITIMPTVCSGSTRSLSMPLCRLLAAVTYLT